MNKEDKAPSIEEVDKKAEELEEEDLSDVDMDLGPASTVEVMAQWRMTTVVTYQQGYMRSVALKASIKANENLGNDSAAKKFGKDLDELQTQLQYMLRGIKALDKAHPKAKARMLEMAEKQSIEAQRR